MSRFLAIEIPNLRSPAISATSETGSITTPLPITQIFPRRGMPEGIRCRIYLTPRWTTVCPALFPPWLRTIMSAFAVSTSMILPFPSSPHCAPIKIILAIESINRQKIFPVVSSRTHSGLPTNHMLAVFSRNKFCVSRMGTQRCGSTTRK